MNRQFIINGENFSTLEEFWDEVGCVLVPEQYWGRNLDAFHDILSWDAIKHPSPYHLVWRNSELSRQRLNHAEKTRWLRERLPNVHPSSREQFLKMLHKAERGEGATVFEELVEIIHDNAEYVELVLE